jgi:hypothetical protein
MDWLPVFSCDVDAAWNITACPGRTPFEASRSLIPTSSSSLPTFVHGTGVERKVPLQMIACHEHGTLQPKRQPIYMSLLALRGCSHQHSYLALIRTSRASIVS